MSPYKDIIAIISARGGSKTIPKKNLLNVRGYPLIAYSIAAAKLAKTIDRVIVSTDSKEIAEVAKKYGAEVPFLRPAKISKDTSTDKEFLDHLLEWLQKHENQIPDYLVHLRPTSPLRNPAKIDEAVRLIQKHPEATSLRSGHKIADVPQKNFALEKGFFVGLFPHDKRPDYHNLPRQTFPPTYKTDGYVDVLKSSFITKAEVIHGEKILAFLTPDTGDIDHLSDLAHVQKMVLKGRWEIYDYLKKNWKPTPATHRLAK